MIQTDLTLTFQDCTPIFEDNYFLSVYFKHFCIKGEGTRRNFKTFLTEYQRDKSTKDTINQSTDHTITINKMRSQYTFNKNILTLRLVSYPY